MGNLNKVLKIGVSGIVDDCIDKGMSDREINQNS